MIFLMLAYGAGFSAPKAILETGTNLIKFKLSVI